MTEERCISIRWQCKECGCTGNDFVLEGDKGKEDLAERLLQKHKMMSPDCEFSTEKIVYHYTL
jgi:hypothetical protein